MIHRIWHGWTTAANADAYQHLLNTTIAPAIMAKAIPGLESLEVLRRDGEDEVEFITVMEFADWSAVEAFAGPEKTGSVVPPAAQALLTRFDSHSQHFDIVARHQPG
ncbi:MAG: antibiotic biosynthesis monooxygenase [Acidimicrobiia bacterium]|nr:antibiotic biosynthesis monooxygenase [Acidimicrobiia bacterium]